MQNLTPAQLLLLRGKTGFNDENSALGGGPAARPAIGPGPTASDLMNQAQGRFPAKSTGAVGGGVGSILGTMLLGPIGGMAGGYLGKHLATRNNPQPRIGGYNPYSQGFNNAGLTPFSAFANKPQQATEAQPQPQERGDNNIVSSSSSPEDFGRGWGGYGGIDESMF